MPKESIKSFQQQLQEALDAGNLEAAKIIVEAMKIANKPAKKKKAVKKTVAKKPKTVKKIVRPKRVELPQFELDYDKPDDALEPKKELIIPTKDEIDDIVDLTQYEDVDLEDDDEEPRLKPQKNRTNRTGDVQCRTEPMNLGNRKIEFFNGNKKEGDAAGDSAKNNPILAKMYSTADAARPMKEKRKVQKAKVRCYICGKIETIPLNLAPNIAKGEGYKCNDCVTSQGE